MKTRLYSPDDYSTLQGWWEGHGATVVPPAMLPELGVIVQDDEQDVAAAFVFFDNSRPIAFAAWFVTRPNLPAKQADLALFVLVEALEQVAKSQDRTILMPMVEKPSFKRWFTRHGYTLGCENAAILIKPI